MRLGAIVLDSGDSEKLSDFYQRLLGWKKERPDDEWIILQDETGKSTPLVFQQVECYEEPKWPPEKGFQQQMLHLDFYVKHDELEKEVARAVACGARLCEAQLSSDWRVLLDTAGHPFCIIPIPLNLSKETK